MEISRIVDYVTLWRLFTSICTLFPVPQSPPLLPFSISTLLFFTLLFLHFNGFHFFHLQFSIPPPKIPDCSEVGAKRRREIMMVVIMISLLLSAPTSLQSGIFVFFFWVAFQPFPDFPINLIFFPFHLIFFLIFFRHLFYFFFSSSLFIFSLLFFFSISSASSSIPFFSLPFRISLALCSHSF